MLDLSNCVDEVTDYGEENPLLMDYFGFPDEVRGSHN
jgi:hypothetical protein